MLTLRLCLYPPSCIPNPFGRVSNPLALVQLLTASHGDQKIGTSLAIAPQCASRGRRDSEALARAKVSRVKRAKRASSDDARG